MFKSTKTHIFCTVPLITILSACGGSGSSNENTTSSNIANISPDYTETIEISTTSFAGSGTTLQLNQTVYGEGEIFDHSYSFIAPQTQTLAFILDGDSSKDLDLYVDGVFPTRLTPEGFYQRQSYDYDYGSYEPLLLDVIAGEEYEITIHDQLSSTSESYYRLTVAEPDRTVLGLQNDEHLARLIGVETGDTGSCTWYEDIDEYVVINFSTGITPFHIPYDPDITVTISNSDIELTETQFHSTVNYSDEYEPYDYVMSRGFRDSEFVATFNEDRTGASYEVTATDKSRSYSESGSTTYSQDCSLKETGTLDFIL